MASGLNDLVQIYRELLERTRRTQKSTPQSSVTILRTTRDSVGAIDTAQLDTTQPAASPQWAISPTWDSAVNIRWSEGGKWA